MRGVCRLFGIGRNTLSGWLKKSVSCRRCRRHWLPPNLRTCWNTMNSGRLWPGARTNDGFGWLYAAAPAKWSLMPLATGAREPVAFCGSVSRWLCVMRWRSRTSGKPTKRWCRKASMSPVTKAAARPITSSASTTRSGNG